MRIARNILKIARKNNVLVARLVQETGKSYPTVLRWFDNNSEMLTTASALKVICEELNMTQEQVLEKQKTA